ncbi:MAG TPA: ATP-binding protein [Gemmatimonadaceae bacterium]|nr:ATP-binding protein [Gemmatimonadaceae bacterium]
MGAAQALTGAQVLRASPVPLMLVGPALQVLMANPALARLTGRDAAVAMTGGVDALVAPDQREAVREWLARARAPEGGPVERAVRVLRADGAVIDTRWAIAPAGDATDVLLVHVQETRAPPPEGGEDLARDAMTRVFWAMPDPAVLVLERDETIIGANEPWCAAIDYRVADVIGARLDSLDIGLDAAARASVHRMLAHGKAVRNVEIAYHRRGDTAMRRASVSVEVVHVSGHEVLLAICRDVTAERGMEEHRRRTQRLEALGRLASSVAHDFNNLLTVILASGQLVGNSFDASDARRGDVAEILKAARSAAGLTKQLLTFGRSATYEPRPVDLNNVVRNVHPILARLLGPDIRLRSVAAREPAWVLADPTALEQVLLNLTVNARDAMPEGGRLLIAVTAVTVTDAMVRGAAADMPPPGSYVRLAVRDSGIGMDEHTRSRLFEPFFTTKSVGRGTGLGLSTVYGIVNQCEGCITVESASGRGTTFRVYLPPLAASGAGGERPVRRGAAA